MIAASELNSKHPAEHGRRRLWLSKFSRADALKPKPSGFPYRHKKNGAADRDHSAEEKSLGGCSKRTEGVGESERPKSAG
jgi:hypothetical protein